MYFAKLGGAARVMFPGTGPADLSRLVARLRASAARGRRPSGSHLKPFFGAMRLDAITSFMVERYKKKRIDAGSANGTVNREFASLSHQNRQHPCTGITRRLSKGAGSNARNRRKKPELQGLRSWRPEAESNRCTRICSPLHSHSAIRPARGGI